MEAITQILYTLLYFLLIGSLILLLFFCSPFVFKKLIEYFQGKSLVNKRRSEKDAYVLLLLKVPKNNQESEKTFEKLLISLHSLIKAQKEWYTKGPGAKDLSFEVAYVNKNIHFYLWVNKDYQKLVEGQLYSHFPEIEIETVEDYAGRSTQNCKVASAEVYLNKGDLVSLKTYLEAESDSFTYLSGALTNLSNSDDEFWMQILLRPVAGNWFSKAISKLRKSFYKTTTEEKQGLYYRSHIRAIYLSPSNNTKLALEQILGFYKQFEKLNKFKVKILSNPEKGLYDYQDRILWRKSYRLIPSEISSIYHFPYNNAQMAGVIKTLVKRSEPPTNLPRESEGSKDISVFAETNFRNERVRFGIKRIDRRKHLYVVGKSGTGKSKLLELLMLEDIKAGKGFGLIDPHGDLAETISKHIPHDQIERVVFFNPADQDYPMAFNLLESTYKQEDKQQIVQGFIGIFRKIFTIDFNPRLEHMIRYIVLALLESPGSTVMGITRLLTDIKFRQKVIANIQDPVVKSFWANEFASYNERYSNEAIVPILNKMGQFLSNPLIRNIVGQPQNAIDFRRIMDEGKILIMNLSRGRLGEENSDLLGSMIITKIQQAAMSRANIPEDERRDFYLYVDEFQNFATTAFANIFTEARKYHLNLTVAHQYLTQLPPEVKGTVFGNVGSLISFRIGADDAGFLAQEFAPTFSPDDLISLDGRDHYLKISIDGLTSPAFSARTINCPNAPENNYLRQIVDYTRFNFAKPRVSVESEISKWQSSEDLTTNGEESFPEPIV